MVNEHQPQHFKNLVIKALKNMGFLFENLNYKLYSSGRYSLTLNARATEIKLGN